MEKVKSAFEVYQKQETKKKRELSLDPEQPENVTKKNKLDKKQQITVKNAKIKQNQKIDLKQKKKKKVKKAGTDNAHTNGVVISDKKKTAFPLVPGPITTKFKKTLLKASSGKNNHIVREKNPFSTSTPLLQRKNKVEAKLHKNSAGSKSEKKSKKVTNGNISSEEDIPTLVPIRNAKNKPKRKLLPSSSNKEKNSKLLSKKEAKPFNPLTYSLGVFKWIIDPISPKDFFDNYWEKDVLHIKRENKDYYKTVFSSERLDQILRENLLYFNRNIDVVTYSNGKKEVMDEEGLVFLGVLVVSLISNFVFSTCRQSFTSVVMGLLQ